MRRPTHARIALLVVLWACAAWAVAPDLARERRWAEQVVPQVLVGDPVWLATPHHPRVLALFTEPVAATGNAIVVVHGLGVHPDWDLIGELRTLLAEFGFATLSVQMPVLAADASREDYATVFPDAAERLDAATDWLRAKGYARVGVVSHSMGAAMANAWLARRQRAAVDAWVPVGMLVDFAAPPQLPVLDVIAEHDFPEVLASAKKRASELRGDRCSGALVIDKSDHYFGGAVQRLAGAIRPFLERALGGDCAK
jgi:pimeloyl-ACP methyl ester carboxylesterase